MHLLNGKTVIADATHINAASRNKLVKNLSAQHYKKIIIVMGTPFEECMKRNAAREGITRVPDDAMYRMRNKFKMPNNFIEEFDKVVTVKV
jgi:predicted kinase